MSALLTQCPHCNTSFRVTEAQQEAAGGLVRCGSCLAVFSAVDNEIRIKPPVQEQALEDIEAFFENLDRENAEADKLEQALNSDEASNPELAFTMEGEMPASGQAASESVDAPTGEPSEEQADELPAMLNETSARQMDEPTAEQMAEEIWNEQVAELQQPAGKIDFATADPDEIAAELLDLAMPESDRLDAAELEEKLAEHVELADHAEQREAFEGRNIEPVADAVEAVSSETISVEPEKVDVEISFYDENDTSAISLGDMKIDEFEEQSEEGSTEEYEAQPEEEECETQLEEEVAGLEQKAGLESEAALSAGTPQRTSAEDKIQVREFLSSLAADEKSLEPVDDTSLDELDEDPLTFTARRQRSFAGTVTLFAVNLLLLAALGVQWLYWNRETLAEHPRFGFLAPYVCSVFACPAPEPLPASSALSSQQLLVRTHPRFPDALELSFIFNNDATTPQPFPNLELAFSDINNQLLANRLFTPAEYLPAELQQFDAMPPQTSVQVMLELADPGEAAVNYNVYFHDR